MIGQGQPQRLALSAILAVTAALVAAEARAGAPALAGSMAAGAPLLADTQTRAGAPPSLTSTTLAGSLSRQGSLSAEGSTVRAPDPARTAVAKGPADATIAAHPVSPTDDTSAPAAHPRSAAAIDGAPGPSASLQHVEPAAPQPPGLQHVASLAPFGSDRLAHEPPTSPSTERTAPDRTSNKPAAALPVRLPQGVAIIKPSTKAGSAVMRTASIVSAPGSKANSIRNRIWLRHLPH